MKVCILSMQKIDNYGSVLQAYSLKKIVEGLGHSVGFIDIKKGNDEILNEQCISSCNYEQKKQISKMAQLFIRIKNRISNRKAHKMYENFRTENLEIEKIDITDKYDVCIIGSDEVFNCLQISKWGFDSQLFGDIKNADKVITYAACCGSTNENLLTKEIRNAIGNYFKNVDSFSVRDENTRSFVQALSHKIPTINLDPVAVGDFEYELTNTKLTMQLPPKYCIIYAYQNRLSDQGIISAILELCKEKNMKPVSVFGSQKWLPQTLILSPFEVLKAFQNAEYVVTDTFHGTLFGAKYAKKMAVIIRESNQNKLIDLVKKLNMEKHVINNAESINDNYNICLNRKKLDSIFLEERIKTISYLQENI